MGNRIRTNWIVVHCSATRPTQVNIGAKDIRQWHIAKGWADIGYHFVIKRNGKLETGRDVRAVGAHVEGHNLDSIGICMVGGINDRTFRPESNYTAAQWATLKTLVADLVKRYPKAKVLGHRDFKGVQKACPCFEAKSWAKKSGFPT